MTSPDVYALQRSGLNEFLFAPVGAEPNGMTLSLVSVFARLGNDPWREAARLAGLAKPAAIDSLARTIAGMPMSVWPLPAATIMATRLITLLPTSAERVPLGPSPAHGTGMTRFLKIVLILTCLAFGAAYTVRMVATDNAPRPDGTAASGLPAHSR